VAADNAARIAAAVREALRLSVERGVASVARPGGFAENPAVRIPMPDQLDRLDAAMRMVGEQRRVERFVTSLSHVAEQSALAARPVLLAAAAEMPIDGPRLLAAGDAAATEALRRYALGRIIGVLDPAVGDAMDSGRVTRRYRKLSRESPMGGLAPPASFDLDAYVVGRTADGLFLVIGQEERRIRTDPAARPTPLLREVFGGHR
jgi:hypothetical protein